MPPQEIKSFLQNYKPEEFAHEVNHTPLVSVLVQTYQHIKYIKDCLDGILMQKTNFYFEILIGEDESTDGTREVCIEYAQKYPEKIKLFLHNSKSNPSKIGLHPFQINAFYNLFTARGKYIATCEGDDYWTDPLKLQKQVTALEKNQNLILVTGGYISKSPFGEVEHLYSPINPSTQIQDNSYRFNFSDLVRKWQTKTLTTVFRNKPQIFEKLLQYKSTRDVHLMYHLLMEGDGMYIQEILGVQNKHLGGIFAPKSSTEQLYIQYEVYKELYFANNNEVLRQKFVDTLFKYQILKYEKPEALKEFSPKPIIRDAVKSLRRKNEYVLFLKLLIPRKIKQPFKRTM